MRDRSVAPIGGAAHYASSALPNRKPTRWVLGIVIAEAAMFGISAYAVSITPLGTMLTILYWAGVVAFGIFGWVWLGADAIPGRRKRSRGAAHSWTVVGLTFIIGGFIAYVPSVSPIAFGLFPAFLLSMAARLAWNYGYNGGIRFCDRCAAFRWFFRSNGEWYCNKQGHKWNEASTWPRKSSATK